MGDGITDFTPSPEESRALIGGSYSVASTLMVRFAEDSIDQTPEMLAILQGQQQQPAAAAAMPQPSSSGGNSSAAASAGSSGAPGGSGSGSEEWRARQVAELVLPGSHVTPCGGDLAWEAGPVFSPLDALAQGAKAASQADVRRLAAQVVGWLGAQQRRP